MAGIYIHIPFCKKRCTYCDFYTEVAPNLIPKLINSIVKEIEVRKNYLPKQLIDTIYFGGGTPSILNKNQFQQIFDAINENYNVSDNAEITFEANPDDLNYDFLLSMRELPFNRISIGIQSFNDSELKRINRRHSGEEAISAIQTAQMVGFNNISIDLIYGLPSQSISSWSEQLKKALSLNIQHISAYGLTYEEGTALWKQRKKGEVEPASDEIMNEMYSMLLDETNKSGFEAYEISNFALKNYRSRHNSSYWKQDAYIGLGPSAHSFDLVSRQWNVSSIHEYINALDNNATFFEKEILTKNDRFNDYVMVSLRTFEGISLRYLELEFGPEYSTYCLQNIKYYIDSKKVIQKDENLCLTIEGIQISNLILIEIMKV